METTPLRSKILDTIIRKSTLKQRVFDNTFAAFNELKETLFEMASECCMKCRRKSTTPSRRKERTK